MPIRNKLVMVAQQLRHTRTRLLPIEIAERVQHTIVRIEQMLLSGAVDTVAADALLIEARKLLEECETSLKS